MGNFFSCHGIAISDNGIQRDLLLSLFFLQSHTRTPKLKLLGQLPRTRRLSHAQDTQTIPTVELCLLRAPITNHQPRQSSNKPSRIGRAYNLTNPGLRAMGLRVAISPLPLKCKSYGTYMAGCRSGRIMTPAGKGRPSV